MQDAWELQYAVPNSFSSSKNYINFSI